MLRRHRMILRRELRRRIKTRRDFLYVYQGRKDAADYLQRYREVSAATWAVAQATSFTMRYTTGVVASMLSAADGRQKKGLLSAAARFIGGREWQRSADERKTWAGKIYLPQFSQSPHVRIHREAMFYGVWSGNPMKKGVNTFTPDGEVCVRKRRDVRAPGLTARMRDRPSTGAYSHTARV